MNKVSIILVNWNGKNHLEKCLPSLLKNNYKSYEVILVDNASTDGSVSFVKSNFPSIKIISAKTNLGFAGGNNLGYRYATGEYVLFLNNDTIVEKDFLSVLVKYLEGHPKVGGVQSKILSMDNPQLHDSVGAFLTNTGFLYHYGYLQKNKAKYDKDIALYTAKGACMLFRKSIIDKVGLFDEDYFAYFEETDFCHRVWLSGYEIRYVHDSVIYHKIGGTSNAMNNSFIQFHSFKNRINSYVKNLSTVELLKILPIHLMLCELSGIAFVLKGKPGHFVAINKSIWWNISNAKTTFKKRREVQSRIRKVEDKEFIYKVKRNPDLLYYYYLFAKSLVGYHER